MKLKAELDILSLHAKIGRVETRFCRTDAQQERQTAMLRQIEASLSNRG